MAVTFYDDALLAKFQKWTAGTEVIITGVNETRRLFEILSDKNNDNPIKLPLITISRPGGYTILNKNKQPMTYNGLKVIKTETGAGLLQAIPIGIGYQIDIYTRLLAEADEYARNLVYNIINYPKLTIEIPYENSKLQHDANIRILSEVEDNSDIPERLVPGQFSRFTIGINIDDAYLWDVRLKDNLKITEINVQSVDKIGTQLIENPLELVLSMKNNELL